MATKKEKQAIPTRSAATKKLNEKLEVIYLPDFKVNGIGYQGYALYIPGKGVLAFKKDKRPYMPIGGLKALLEILDEGGLLSYADIKFYKMKDSQPYEEINSYKGRRLLNRQLQGKTNKKK